MFGNLRGGSVSQPDWMKALRATKHTGEANGKLISLLNKQYMLFIETQGNIDNHLVDEERRAL